MKKALILFWFCLGLALPAAAQQPSPAEGDTAAIYSAIERLFGGMRAGDSTAVRSVFAPSLRLMTVTTQAGGEATVRETSADRFVKAVGGPHDEVWDERIWDVEIRRDGPLASGWVPYAFYLGDEMSHCGTNAFQLAKLDGAWKIVQITDTRRTDCDGFVPEAVRSDGP